jgi:MFS family permease
MIAFGLFSLGAGLSSNITELTIFRVLQGVSGAALFPCGMSLTAAAFPKDQQIKALGIYNSIIGVGMAMGPLLGGFIVSYMGWRWIFFVNLPIIVASLTICIWAISGHDQKTQHRIDWFGIGLLASALTLLVFSISQGPDFGWHSPIIIGALMLALAFCALFIMLERRSDDPLIPIALFKNHAFLIASLIYIATVGTAWAVVFMAPLYLHHFFSYPTYQVGLLLLPMTAMTAIAPSFAGELLDAKGALACVMLITLLLIPAYALQIVSNDILVVLFALTLFGTAWGMGNGICVPLALSELDDLSDSGLVSGAAITVLNVGGVLMLSIAATVLHSYQTIALAQAKTPKEAFFSGYQAAVVVILAMTLLMLAIAFWSALSRQRAQRDMPDQVGANKPA